MDSFAERSVVIRLPDIARRTIDENQFPTQVVDKIVTLIGEIPDATIRQLDDPGAPDLDEWQQYIDLYQNHSWLQVPWFFAEAYFYRRILEATGYFQPGPMAGVDPFTLQKQLGLEKTLDAIEILANYLLNSLSNDFCSQSDWRYSGISHFLSAALWGNQVDLSMWPFGKGREPIQTNLGNQNDHLLVDDRYSALAYLLKTNYPPKRVDILVDNAGFELVCDLCLADFLLTSKTVENAILQLKAHPTFVSDAVHPDIHNTINFLIRQHDPATRDLGNRLLGHVDQERILLKDHFFWNSPLPMWEAPLTLAHELSQSHLVISKGDANYRRLLGDRHWPFTTPFSKIVSFIPVPVLALRSLKSEVISGLTPSQPEDLDREDPQWLINGRWGIIQFHYPQEL